MQRKLIFLGRATSLNSARSSVNVRETIRAVTLATISNFIAAAQYFSLQHIQGRKRGGGANSGGEATSWESCLVDGGMGQEPRPQHPKVWPWIFQKNWVERPFLWYNNGLFVQINNGRVIIPPAFSAIVKFYGTNTLQLFNSGKIKKPTFLPSNYIIVSF